MARNKRAQIYVNAAFTFGVILIAAWINLTIRHGFHRDGLHVGFTPEVELYTYSIVWLLIAIALLAIGIFYNEKKLRLVSVGVFVVVVAKVFLGRYVKFRRHPARLVLHRLGGHTDCHRVDISASIDQTRFQ